MARKRLVDMEDDIKLAIEKDVNDPKVFSMIKELTTAFITRNKLVSNYNDVEEVSLLMAEDLYMKAINGEPVYSWIGYINKAKMGYIRKFRRMTQSEIIDITDDDQLREGIITMSASGSSAVSYRRFEDLVDEISLVNISEKIDNVLENESRYYRYSSVYVNTYMSILLSIISGSKCYFCLDEAESMYLDILSTKVSDMLRKDIFKLRSTFDLNYTPMTLFYLEEGTSDGNPDQ